MSTVDEWFLCGPFAMVEQARAVLGEHDVAPGNIHTELFHVDGEAPRESVVVVDERAEGPAR